MTKNKIKRTTSTRISPPSLARAPAYNIVNNLIYATVALAYFLKNTNDPSATVNNTIAGRARVKNQTQEVAAKAD
jgi:hypothetical protein